MNTGLRIAAARAGPAATCGPLARGGTTLSTRPATSAAATIPHDSTAKPNTPARHPADIASPCPIGAATSAPTDPAADTIPSTRLRECAGTAWDATDIAMADAVQASARPISTPAPITTATMPCADPNTTSPAT